MNITIDELNNLISTSESPIHILVGGAVGSGKSYFVENNINGIDILDPDLINISIDGEYNRNNTAKAMAKLRNEVKNKLVGGESFLQQGTLANLQSTINKLKTSKTYGFKTIMIYIDTRPSQAFKQIKNRVLLGGHGSTITEDKIKKTYFGSKLTYRCLTGNQMDLLTVDDIKRVQQALNKTEQDYKSVLNLLDFYLHIS